MLNLVIPVRKILLQGGLQDFIEFERANSPVEEWNDRTMMSAIDAATTNKYNGVLNYLLTLSPNCERYRKVVKNTNKFHINLAISSYAYKVAMQKNVSTENDELKRQEKVEMLKLFDTSIQYGLIDKDFVSLYQFITCTLGLEPDVRLPILKQIVPYFDTIEAQSVADCLLEAYREAHQWIDMARFSRIAECILYSSQSANQIRIGISPFMSLDDENNDYMDIVQTYLIKKEHVELEQSISKDIAPRTTFKL